MYIFTYIKHFTCTLEQINSIQITTVRQPWQVSTNVYMKDGWVA